MAQTITLTRISILRVKTQGTPTGNEYFNSDTHTPVCITKQSISSISKYFSQVNGSFIPGLIQVMSDGQPILVTNTYEEIYEFMNQSEPYAIPIPVPVIITE